MADYFLKNGKKYYKKNDRPCNSSNSDSNNCFIQNYTIFGTGNTPQDLDITTGIPRTVFENFTKIIIRHLLNLVSVLHLQQRLD